MWQLTLDNALAWMKDQGLLGPTATAQIETLAGGVSGVVLCVVHGQRRTVLKQSCEQLRTREAWFSDPERILREADIMDLLCSFLPEHTVPKVLHLDRQRFVLAMAHAPKGATPWKARLLSGEVDPHRGRESGALLGTIHKQTAARRSELGHLSERKVFEQLRIEPFYEKIHKRHPDLGRFIVPLIEGMRQRQDALCHGDFSPKNLLIHPTGVTLVDHETAHLGDPAMDVGFFFSHLILKALRAGSANWQHWKELIDLTLQGYWEHADPEARQDINRRSLDHLAVCILARVDGTSPVDYLQEPQRQAARQLGRQLLLDRVTNYHAALDRVAQALEWRE